MAVKPIVAVICGLAFAAGCTSSDGAAPSSTTAEPSADQTVRVDVETETGTLWIDSPLELIPEPDSKLDLLVARGSVLRVTAESCILPYVEISTTTGGSSFREPESFPGGETLEKRDLSLYVPQELPTGPYKLRVACSYWADSPDTVVRLDVEIVDRPGLAVPPPPEVYPISYCVLNEEGTGNECTTLTR